jgi:molecular chaperone DnaJ
VATSDSIRVSLPPGIEEGSTQRVPGAGSRTRPDRAAGDLEVTIGVAPHPVFRRDGDDVLCTLSVAFTRAALGGDVDVPTLEGKTKLRVPAGTQPVTTLRMRGKGIPRRKGIGRGDQRVEIAIEVPTNLTPRQRQLLEDFAGEVGTSEPAAQRKSFMGKLREILG